MSKAMGQYEDLDRVLVTKEEIAEKVRELGERITQDYKGKQVLVVQNTHF